MPLYTFPSEALDALDVDYLRHDEADVRAMLVTLGQDPDTAFNRAVVERFESRAYEARTGNPF